MTDWRDTLFVWRGKIQLYPDFNELRWKGTWVGTEDPINDFPKVEDFTAEMKNTFEQVALYAECTKEATCVKSRSHYMLDNGGGHLATQDDKHRMYFLLPPGCTTNGDGFSGTFKSYSIFRDYKEGSLERWLNPQRDSTAYCAVCAKGKTIFGPFVSKGIIKLEKNDVKNDVDAGYSWILTLARRYVDEDDPRLKFDATPEGPMNFMYYDDVTGKDKLPYGALLGKSTGIAVAALLQHPWRHLELYESQRRSPVDVYNEIQSERKAKIEEAVMKNAKIQRKKQVNGVR